MTLDSNQVAWLYGTNNAGNRGMILAINIKDRLQLTGGNASSYTFNLPPEATSNIITVLNENRTITANNKQFTDNFTPYAVHIYTFPVSAISKNGKNKFDCGWWVDVGKTAKSVLADYVAHGQTVFKLDGFLTSLTQLPDRISWLNAVQSVGAKAWISLNNAFYPSLSIADFTSAINTFKTHPALLGYYIADEPDDGPWNAPHTLSASVEAPYYNAVHSLDPNHPVFISLGGPSPDWSTSYWEQEYTTVVKPFYQYADAVGFHPYPFSTANAEFKGTKFTHLYDDWKRYISDVNTLGKKIISTGQGWHDSSHRDPTKAENRYQVYIPIVLGSKSFMWWLDSWSTATMKTMVNETCAELQQIAEELNNGVSFYSPISDGSGSGGDVPIEETIVLNGKITIKKNNGKIVNINIDTTIT